jgi:hypothetical protein
MIFFLLKLILYIVLIITALYNAFILTDLIEISKKQIKLLNTIKKDIKKNFKKN